MKIWIFTTLICSFGLGMSIIDASKKQVPISGRKKVKAVIQKTEEKEEREKAFIDIIADEAGNDLNETAEKLIKGAEELQKGAKELGDIAKDTKSLLTNVGDISEIVANFSNLFSR